MNATLLLRDSSLLWVAATVLKSVSVLALALLARGVMRRRSAAHRYAVVCASIVAILVLPVIGFILPRWDVQVPVSPMATSVVVAPAPAPTALATSPAVATPPLRRPRTLQRESRPVRAESPAAEPTLPSAPLARKTARFTWPSPAKSLLLLWISGAVVVVLRFSASRFQLGRLLRRCSAISDDRLLSAAENIRREIGVRNPAPLLSSTAVDVPFAAGVFRPAVVLPASAAEWSTARLHCVLRHELAHVRRCDGLWQLLAEIAASIYWFNPLVWLATRALRVDRERACDDLVLAAGARASDYADDLIHIAMRADAVSNCAAALAMARRSQLEGRVIAVLTPDITRTYSRRAFVVVIAAAIAVVLPLAALHAAQNSAVHSMTPIAANAAAPALAAHQPEQAASTPPSAKPTAPEAPVATIRTQSSQSRPYVEDVELPALPAMPAMPALPALPAMPAMPAVPAMAGATMPPPPAMPALPAMPAMPAMPALPAIPSFGGQVRFSTAPTNSVAATAPSPAFACMAADTDAKHSSNNWSSSNNGHRTWRVSISGNGCSVDLRADGLLTFNSNVSGLESIENGGYLEVTERAGGTTRHLEANPQGDGSIQYAYSVNGSNVAFEPEGRTWFASLLLGLDRQSGFAAAVRVPALLRSGGVTAVLDEITRLSGDYARARYYIVLLDQAQLDSNALHRVLQGVGTQVKSDYERARVLVMVAGKYDLSDQASQTDFVGALEGVKSDYERARVLVSLLSRAKVTPAATTMVLANASRIKSDYERSRVLVSVAQHGLLDAKTADAYFQAAAAINSDYERARSYVAGLQASTLDEATLIKLLQSVGTMKSDYEMARVLVYVADRARSQGAIRDQYIRTAESIRSDYERARALYAVGVRPASL